MLKGKAIALYYNSKTLDEDNRDDLYKAEAKFMYIPINSLVTENNMVKLMLSEMKTSEELLKPFADFKENEEQLFWLERA